MDKSVLLQKQIKDNSEDIRSEFLDLKNWEEQMKRKERELLSERNEQPTLPPIRSKNKKKSLTKENKSTENSKRIKGYDYASWDKFDADKACIELENEKKSDDSSSEEEPVLTEELKEKHDKALQHKQQGNTFVEQKKWEKAIASYSEAIKIFPDDAVFYANRALCYLKQNNLSSAALDCSFAIQLDNEYVKAYHRRATARMGLKKYKEAKQDIEKVLTFEPSNKEAQALLNQVDKRLENLKPVIMSGGQVVKDVPIERKMAEKMFDNAKSDTKLIDIKKDKDKKNDTNVQSITKVPSVTEPRKDPRIPNWLPEKDNVEIVKPIVKLPHLHSKEPLKRILVQEADLSKPFQENNETACSKNQHVELPDIRADNNIKRCNGNVKKYESEQKFLDNSTEIIVPVPKTAVQFLVNWKKYTSSDFRYRYLKQLPPGSLPKIFQDSMESDIFSDILATLKTEFINREKAIFSYLKDLSHVKRFRAFIMFISNSEKQDLQRMFLYCKTSEKIPESELMELQNKYEV